MPRKQPEWITSASLDDSAYYQDDPYVLTVGPNGTPPTSWWYAVDEIDTGESFNALDSTIPTIEEAKAAALAKMEELKKRPPKYTRCEIRSGPDSRHRYHFTLWWKAEWMDGYGPKEEWKGEKGQCFHGTLPLRRQVSRVKDIRGTKTPLKWPDYWSRNERRCSMNQQQNGVRGVSEFSCPRMLVRGPTIEGFDWLVLARGLQFPSRTILRLRWPFWDEREAEANIHEEELITERRFTMEPTTNTDRIDWDKPTFLVGTPCSHCQRPADGFLIAPNGGVIEGQVCKKHGREARAGRFEPGVVFKDWMSKNEIRGIPVRLKKEKVAHIGLGHVNRTHCKKDTVGAGAYQRRGVPAVGEARRTTRPTVARV